MVSRFIIDGLKLLWPLDGNDERVLLKLSNAVLKIVKTGLKKLNKKTDGFYLNLIHV